MGYEREPLSGQKQVKKNNGTGRRALNRFLPWVLLAGAAVGLLLLAGYSWAFKTVTVRDGGREWKVKTTARTVGELLRTEGVELKEGDQVDPPLGTRLTEGMQVNVVRAVPVRLKVDGKVMDVSTTAKSVRELLQEQGVELGELDEVIPQLDEELAAGTVVEVVRVSKKVVEERVNIPFRVVRVNSSQLARGLTSVVQQGREGVKLQRWEVIYRNGREAERRLLETEILKRPVDRIVRVGTLATVSRGGYEIRFSRVLEMLASAYTYTGNNTASGVPPRVGMAAVDPQVIPLGTRLFVEGYGYCVAVDKGSAIKGYRIDLFMETEAQARKWGMRRVKVYILE